MKVLRRIVVLDAADLESESGFWAGLLDGTVHRDPAWHSVVVDGEWVLAVQHAPDHVAPQWPGGPQQQQVHLDLHVDDLAAADRLARSLGGRQLKGPAHPADDPAGVSVFAVYASPAGHPLCFGVH